MIPKKFKFGNTSAVVPNSLVVSYALAIAIWKSCTNSIAGFDGCPSEDPRRVEMDEVFELFQYFVKQKKKA